MADYATHEAVVNHFAREMLRGALPPGNYGVVTPPPPGRCGHCGAEVPVDQRLTEHSIAGTPLKMLITHCDDCHETHPDCVALCGPVGG